MPKTDPISIFRIALGFSCIAIQSLIMTPLFILFLPSRYHRIRLGNLYGKTVVPFILIALGTRFRIKNKEKLDGQFPAIYLSNHSSQIDPLIAIKLAPFGACGVAKKEIASVPFFGWTYRLSGHLLLDRSNRESAIASMAKLNEAIKQFRLGVWIWPEGTRSRDGRLLPFKKGFAHMALATGLPVVPIVVTQAQNRWPSKSLKINPGDVHIEVLDAIPTTDWTEENIEEHVQKVWEIYVQHLPEDQKPPPNEY